MPTPVSGGDLRTLLDTDEGTKVLLDALEGRIARHALDAGAEQMLKRYLLRYVLPVLTVIFAVLAFFGWQVKATVTDAVAHVQADRDAVALQLAQTKAQVGEASDLIGDSAKLQERARLELTKITDDRAKFGTDIGSELGRIAQQHDNIDARTAFIDARANAATVAATNIDSNLREASQKLEDATRFHDTIKASAERAQATADEAQRLSVAAATLLKTTQVQAADAIKVASDVKADAEVVRNYATLVRGLQDITGLLLRAGISETVILRSNRESAIIQVPDLAMPTSAVGLALKFNTPDIKRNGFTMNYAVNGQQFKERLPAADRLPYTFALKGSKDQYQVVVDFIYSDGGVPDFMSLRVRPNAKWRPTAADEPVVTAK